MVFGGGDPSLIAVVTDVFMAEMSRAHNDANVLCLGQRVITAELAKEIVKIW